MTSLHAYLDTEILALAFRKMAAEGIGRRRPIRFGDLRQMRNP